MKLRNFLYINSKLLDDYISAIDGYVYEEETQKLNEINQKAANAKANVLGIGGDGKYEKQSSEEVKEKCVLVKQQNSISCLNIYPQMNIPL